MRVSLRLAPPLRGWLVLTAALCCVSCSGSGASLNPVHGKVIYKGQPLKGALVTFHPTQSLNEVKAARPVGLTKDDGTFSLTTGQNEGAPAGDYVVTLICSEEVPQPGGKKVFSTAPPESRDRFGGAYANAATSQIKVSIKSGPNQLEPFELK